MFATIINQLPDDTFRRCLTVIAEEMFFGIFRDYLFMYDPKNAEAKGSSTGSRGPRSPMAGSPGGLLSSTLGQLPTGQLNEERVASGVPYFAVVQSLREAAKDAIMRRLELEAQLACEKQTAASLAAEAAEEKEDASVEDPSLLGKVQEGVDVDEEETSAQLRTSLRNARRLVQTYQARTLELERTRLDMEEEVSRSSKEREKEELLRLELEKEVRKLRGQLREETNCADQLGSLPSETGRGSDKWLPKSKRPVEQAVEEEETTLRAHAEDPKEQAAERQALHRVQDSSGVSLGPASTNSGDSVRQSKTPRERSVPAGGAHHTPAASTASMASYSASSTAAGGADVAAGGGSKVRRSYNAVNGANRSPSGGSGVRFSTRGTPSATKTKVGSSKRVSAVSSHQVPLAAN